MTLAFHLWLKMLKCFVKVDAYRTVVCKPQIQPQNIAKNLTLAFGLSRIVMFQPGFRYYILGHPDWDEDRPGRNLEGMKWEKKQADQIKTEKRKRATVWKKGL